MTGRQHPRAHIGLASGSAPESIGTSNGAEWTHCQNNEAPDTASRGFVALGLGTGAVRQPSPILYAFESFGGFEDDFLRNCVSSSRPQKRKTTSSAVPSPRIASNLIIVSSSRRYCRRTPGLVAVLRVVAALSKRDDPEHRRTRRQRNSPRRNRCSARDSSTK